MQGLSKEGIACFGIIPISYEDKLLGTLNIGSTKEQTFSSPIKKLLEIIANKVCDSILRYNSETRAKESEQRWKFALEGNGHVVCEWHMHKGLMKISENANELFEYNVSEMIKKESNFNNLFHQEDLLVMQDKIEHMDSNEQNFLLEHRIITKDGKIKWVLNRGMFLQNLTDKDSKILLFTLTEITHIKNLQAELISTKEAAESANKAKSNFLANMSHEIRTPMTGIIGLTDLTLLSDLSDSDRHNLKIVMHSAMSLLTIINDILDYSKIEADIIEFNNKPLKLRNMLEEIFQLFDVSAKQKNIEFNITIAEDVPSVVLGDEVRITQVLSNLVSNAIKFTKVGHVHILVEVSNYIETPPKLRFSVEDTGIGIPADKINMLFKRFSQLDDSNTKQFSGTGLGLAISKKLSELMGGEIIVESNECFGSKFIFTTLLNIPDISLDEPESVILDEATTKIEHSNFKILVAEDDEVSCMFIERILELNGYQYLITKNGKEAVEAFKLDTYDLVLMDIQMPIMDGFTATKLIRELDKNATIIAMTAYALIGDRNKCLDAGMNDYITKPNVISFLSKTLDKWLT